MTDTECIVIDTIELPADRIDDFVAQWRQRAEIVSKADGFRDARLHRAIEQDGVLPLVMVAHWDSAEDKDVALSDPAFRNSAASSGGFATVRGALYTVAAEYRSVATPQGAGITFVNAFVLPADRVDEFATHWHGRAALMSRAPGFRDNRLHRAITQDAHFQLVNIAHWDSAEAWQAAGTDPAFQQRLAAAPTFATANPALYEVVAEF
ncbi:antibiotic biosynthesis monooxygenase family protein [Nocardia sp. GCM10030253]|uniref:antibiotic biosynthesis monooxygenase family protein n=1 Tax=Nocardia sp. GCM10030253 TaxID=3273404 RepID=UPI00362FF0DC